MYYCDNCKEFFAEPTHGCCPYCMVDDYDAAERCEICGAWIASGEDRCDYCDSQISRQMRSVLDAFDGAETRAVLRGIEEWLEKEAG